MKFSRRFHAAFAFLLAWILWEKVTYWNLTDNRPAQTTWDLADAYDTKADCDKYLDRIFRPYAEWTDLNGEHHRRWGWTHLITKSKQWTIEYRSLCLPDSIDPRK